MRKDFHISFVVKRKNEEGEEEGRENAHHLLLGLNHLPAFMSLKLIIYGDIFKHGELHQGELSFFLLTRTKEKEKNKGNCLMFNR